MIIGPELRYDPASRRYSLDRDAYRDAKGKENDPKRGTVYTDDDSLRYIRNTFRRAADAGDARHLRVCARPGVREHLRVVIGVAGGA